MKKHQAWILYVALGAARLIAAGDESHSIIERGPHHRLWVNVTSTIDAEGQTVSRTNRYTEIAAGICYQNEKGDWLDSQEVIDIVPGGALASQGAHQVGFAANANTFGAINMLTPDGKRLRSHVLGLAYLNARTGQSIWIAVTKDSIGELVGQNQIIYRDAFDDGGNGTKADIRYIYTRGALEQDIVFRPAGSPPPPEAYGFDPADIGDIRLEVITECVEAPDAEITETAISTIDDPIKRAAMALPDFADQNISLGSMQMIAGQAFPINADENRMEESIPTGKAWVLRNQRRFLIEAVAYPAIKPYLAALATRAAGKQEVKARAVQTFPPAPAHAKKAETIKMASVRAKENGFCIDYTLVNGSASDYTFAADKTYFISGSFTLNGTQCSGRGNGYQANEFCERFYAVCYGLELPHFALSAGYFDLNA